MLPPEVSTWLLAQGPAGVIILLLILVIIYLFKRWDADREELIAHGAKYAELATSITKVMEVANTNATSIIESIQTFKLLSDLDRRKRP